MKDEEQIKDYKIDSKKFIVVMKKKEKVDAAVPPPAAAVPLAATTSKPDSSSTAATAPKPEEKKAEVASSAAASSGDNEGVIRNMMELGYPRRLVEAALRLSYNNPDVACEYLISDRITEANMDSVEADNLALGGVRDELMDLAEAYDNSRGQAAGGNSENEPLAFLRSQPQFHQMRSQIQENPQFLNTVLQQIGVNNPGLLKLISENQTAFVNMINEPLNNNSTSTNRNTSAAASTTTAAAAAQPATAAAPERMDQDQSGGGQDLDLTANDDLLAATLASQLGEEDDEEEEQVAQPGGGAPQQQQQQPQQIQVELPELSDSDRAAIVRIREISGFSELEVVQAYIACGKNEELALNFLFTD